MYRLLIVDDEPFIVDGLTALFEQEEALDLEVHQAFDGEEALAAADRLRMDIVLTDIQMPGMNGIALQQAIAAQWPRCKVIFLTGYDDFHYVQTSIRGGAIDYVLKAEGDENIVAAVQKAIALIQEEHTYDKLLEGARSELKAAMPIFRKEYMLALLRGEPSTPESRRLRFAELGIPLAGEREVLLALGRVDRWRERMAPGDKMLFAYSVNNILEEHFADTFHSVYVAYEQDRFVWLLQPKTAPDGAAGTDWERLAGYALGTLEAVQASCRECLKLSCSFVVGSGPADWLEAPAKFDRLNGLFLRGLGTGSEVLLSDRHLLRASRLQERDSLRKIALLAQYLEQKETDKFAALYEEIMGAVQGRPAMQTGLALETFYQMSALFISYLNRWEQLEDMAGEVNINRLFSLQEHASWEEATRFFRTLAERLFDRRTDESEREMNEVVRRIHEYAEAHLEGDLSLNQLSDIVHLTPYYLSRLYKQKTGENITDYIATARVAKANELLGATPLKIQEIAVRVGYESASYFTRFYKKMTGQTPQEYRDSLKR
ncbi:MAG: response regulator [Paenibacillaceae bacterium]|nr:response regulator [Paenibacillaceae bacterium]